MTQGKSGEATVRFAPPTLGGKPADVRVVVPFNF